MREEIERGNGFELLTKMKNTLSSFSADFFFFWGGGGRVESLFKNAKQGSTERQEKLDN